MSEIDVLTDGNADDDEGADGTEEAATVHTSKHTVSVYRAGRRSGASTGKSERSRHS